MAAKRRASLDVDYAQLNSFSSVVLYDTSGSKNKRGKLYDVERIIERRKTQHDYEYLIKWRGWPLDSCSWEKEMNLTKDLLRSYKKPVKVADDRLQEACRHFACGVLSALKSPSLLPIYVNMDLDIWRYTTYQKGKPTEHRGHLLFEKEDFLRFKYLPLYWWYFLNDHGEGMAVDFPVKIKPVLSWSQAHCYVKGKTLFKASRYPLEKLCVTIAKRPCNKNNLLHVSST